MGGRLGLTAICCAVMPLTPSRWPGWWASWSRYRRALLETVTNELVPMPTGTDHGGRHSRSAALGGQEPEAEGPGWSYVFAR